MNRNIINNKYLIEKFSNLEDTVSGYLKDKKFKSCKFDEKYIHYQTVRDGLVCTPNLHLIGVPHPKNITPKRHLIRTRQTIDISSEKSFAKINAVVNTSKEFDIKWESGAEKNIEKINKLKHEFKNTLINNLNYNEKTRVIEKHLEEIAKKFPKSNLPKYFKKMIISSKDIDVFALYIEGNLSSSNIFYRNCEYVFFLSTTNYTNLNCNPGLALLRNTIKNYQEIGITEIDLGNGIHGYKKKIANEIYEINKIYIYPYIRKNKLLIFIEKLKKFFYNC